MKNVILIMVAFFAFHTINAQNYFTPAIEVFSMKKPSYITLKDGTEVEGTFKKAKRKKGLFKSITIKVGDEKREIMASDIKHMYLPQSGWDKALKSPIFDRNILKMGNSDMNMEYLKDGYAYFEVSEVIVGKKTISALLQLLNPAFSGKVKVYHDPWAQETSGVGVGGLEVGGGNAKSYYIKMGDKPAYKLKKGKYKKAAPEIYDGCNDFLNKTDVKLSWLKFGEMLMAYTEECGK